jgi:hypothetical protein
MDRAGALPPRLWLWRNPETRGACGTRRRAEVAAGTRASFMFGSGMGRGGEGRGGMFELYDILFSNVSNFYDTSLTAMHTLPGIVRR